MELIRFVEEDPSALLPIVINEQRRLSPSGRQADISGHFQTTCRGSITSVTHPSFVFIQEPGDTGAGRSYTIRRKVRSQAKTYANANRTLDSRFIPWDDGAGTPPEAKSKPKAGTKKRTARLQGTLRIPCNISSQGYERARLEFDFDILILSGLTSIHIGRGAPLVRMESRIEKWLEVCREPSYLDFIPSYYDKSPLLKTVVDCTLARYRYSLSNQLVKLETVLELYGWALVQLREALRDSERCYSDETLLATSVMQLYELLAHPATDRWSHHFFGLMKLIEMASPARCSTGVGLSVFAIHFCPIVTACVVDQRDCFVANPEWGQMRDSVAGSCPLITKLLDFFCACPQFLRQAKEYILSSDYQLEVVDRLTQQGLQMKERTDKWHQDFQIAQREDTTPDLDMDQLLCGAWCFEIVTNRILVALKPLDPIARSLEEETQICAAGLVDLAGQRGEATQTRFDIQGMPTTPKIIAQIAITTKDDWERVLAGFSDALDARRQVIDGEIFDKWSKLMASKEPTRKVSFLKQPHAQRH